MGSDEDLPNDNNIIQLSSGVVSSATELLLNKYAIQYGNYAIQFKVCAIILRL